MSQTSSLPSFTKLTNALKKTQAESEFHVSQIHGLLCGLISANPKKLSDQAWKKRILGSTKNPPAEKLLHQLLEITYYQLTEFSFEFSLLLPNDQTDINDRTEALGLWCQGFLIGFGQIEHHESDDLQDALDDLIEIANVNYGNMKKNNEDENAYIELVEYVRLAALLIFHETRSPTKTKDEINKDVFH